MKLFHGYLLWVFIIVVEIFMLYEELYKGGVNKEFNYTLLAVTLLVGAIGLLLFRNPPQYQDVEKRKIMSVSQDKIISPKK